MHPMDQDLPEDPALLPVRPLATFLCRPFVCTPSLLTSISYTPVLSPSLSLVIVSLSCLLLLMVVPPIGRHRPYIVGLLIEAPLHYNHTVVIIHTILY